MANWQESLIRLRDGCKDLPEPWDEVYLPAPPSGQPWPKALPPCPPLAEFYAICDGGSLGLYSLSPLDEIEEETSSVKDWADDFEDLENRPASGRWFAFGHNEYSHNLIWDAARDVVLCYDSDGSSGLRAGGPDDFPLLGLPIAEFLTGLFAPDPSSVDESERQWAESLKQLGILG